MYCYLDQVIITPAEVRNILGWEAIGKYWTQPKVYLYNSHRQPAQKPTFKHKVDAAKKRTKLVTLSSN